MKMKKLIAVLLTAVMALTFLTACGGGGGGGSSVDKGPFKFTYAELVAKTNDKIGANGPTLVVDPKVGDEVKTALDAYQTAYINAYMAAQAQGKSAAEAEEIADNAGQKEMGKVSGYYMFALGATRNSDVTQLAGILAQNIMSNKNVNTKKELKTYGAYVDLGVVSGQEEYKGLYLIYVFLK